MAQTLSKATWLWTNAAGPPPPGHVSTDTGIGTTTTKVLYSEQASEVGPVPVSEVMVIIAAGDVLRLDAETSTTVWTFVATGPASYLAGVWTIPVSIASAPGPLTNEGSVLCYFLTEAVPASGSGATLVSVDTFRKVLDIPETMASDAELEEVLLATQESLLQYLVPDTLNYQGNSAVTEAALGMSVQVWQARQAPGGQMVGVDLNPQQTPYLLGPGLVLRFQGLLGPWMPQGGAVVA